MHNLSILVVDANNNGIEQVSLSLTYNNQTYQQYSDIEGKSSFVLQSISNDEYDVASLLVFKDNYQQKTYIDLQIFDGVNSSLKVILLSDEYDDETIIIESHKLGRRQNA